MLSSFLFENPRKNIWKIVLCAIALLLAINLCLLILQSKHIENQFKNTIKATGVSEADIISLSVSHSYFNQFILGSAPWSVSARYSDEPEIEYSYVYKQGQFSDSGVWGNHKVMESYKPLKHYLTNGE